MKSIYCLLYFLVFPSVAFAADNEFSIKLKGLPVDGIEWGSSPKEMNIDQNKLECEPREQNGTECLFFIKQNNRSIFYNFTNNRLLQISIYSSPPEFASELELYRNGIGMEPKYRPVSEKDDEYNWQTAHARYRLIYNKNTGRCRFYGYPSLYVEMSTRQPAKDKFKLLDLTLGYSGPNQLIEVANLNKWIRFAAFEIKDNEYSYKNLGLNDVLLAEFKFIDNKLETISYLLTPNIIKTNYFDMLSKKYGNPSEDNGSYVIWKTNADTRDEITIGLEYNKTHNKVEKIWYRHDGLSAKDSDDSIVKLREKDREKKKVFQEAF
jgi:hypothetical protein